MATNTNSFSPNFSGYTPLNTNVSFPTGTMFNNAPIITTYGAIILPFDIEEVLKKNKVQNNPKITNSFKGKLRSALKLSPDENLIKSALKSPIQTFRTMAEYMYDNRNEISGLMNTIGSKFSGIAVTQALINGKVTSKEALDYLFMGFAPALGVTGSLFGYSGLNQMKDALFNGSINVGAFISGFTRTLKGGVDLKDMLTKKTIKASANVLEFDLTISHNENYQSETPDRRVQNGQSLNEFIHNMPETFDVQCALQEGKRYSKAEFRAIIQEIRNNKEVISLALGDEIFDNLMLTGFSPTHDCTKSGMDYTLSFKKIYRNDIDETTEVSIQKLPKNYIENNLATSGANAVSKIQGVGNVNIPPIPPIKTPTTADVDAIWQKKYQRWLNGESMLEIIMNPNMDRNTYDALFNFRR